VLQDTAFNNTNRYFFYIIHFLYKYIIHFLTNFALINTKWLTFDLQSTVCVRERLSFNFVKTILKIQLYNYLDIEEELLQLK